MENKPESKPLICVFATSSLPDDRDIKAGAYILGATIGREGFDMIISTSDGLGGIVANAAVLSGAAVTEVCLRRNFPKRARDGLQAEIRAVAVQDDAARFDEMMLNNYPVGAVVMAGGGLGTLEKGFKAMKLAVKPDRPPVVLAHTGDALMGLAHYFRRSLELNSIPPENMGAIRDWRPGETLKSVLKIGD